MQKGYNMLAEILSSRIRVEIFRLLFGSDNAALHMREIERKSGFAIGTVQRELRKLVKLDLIKKTKDGNRTYYQANKENPIYQDIFNIVQKTVGLIFLLKEALSQSTEIEFAFIFGSFAAGKQNSHSDIDLMVIGNLGLRNVVSLLSGISEKTGREINPHVISKLEFINRTNLNDHFILNIIDSNRIFIMGTEDEFTKLVK